MRQITFPHYLFNFISFCLKNPSNKYIFVFLSLMYIGILFLKVFLPTVIKNSFFKHLNGQNNFWNRISHYGRFLRSIMYIRTTKMPIGTDNCDVKTYRNKLENIFSSLMYNVFWYLKQLDGVIRQITFPNYLFKWFSFCLKDPSRFFSFVCAMYILCTC